MNKIKVYFDNGGDWESLSFETKKMLSLPRYCIYSEITPATKECLFCHVPMCSMCGYIVQGDDLCNACYVRFNEDHSEEYRELKEDFDRSRLDMFAENELSRMEEPY